MLFDIKVHRRYLSEVLIQRRADSTQRSKDYCVHSAMWWKCNFLRIDHHNTAIWVYMPTFIYCGTWQNWSYPKKRDLSRKRKARPVEVHRQDVDLLIAHLVRYLLMFCFLPWVDEARRWSFGFDVRFASFEKDRHSLKNILFGNSALTNISNLVFCFGYLSFSSCNPSIVKAGCWSTGVALLLVDHKPSPTVLPLNTSLSFLALSNTNA